MNIWGLRIKAFILALLIHTSTVLAGQPDIQWQKFPPLPDKEGFAGMYAGLSNGALLCMGGANFPEGRPWEGGEKVWYDAIYVLEKKEGDWKQLEEKLPQPIAYGGTVSYKNKIILLGGNDAVRYFSKVWSVEYANGSAIITNELPDLPLPIGYTSVALVGSRIFVAGGRSSHESNEPVYKVWVLDLESSTKAWAEIEPWPGLPRFNAVAGAYNGDFYLFSGITMVEKDSGEWERKILIDAYSFKLGSGEGSGSGKWIRLADMPRGTGAAPGPAILLQPAYFVITGGVDAEIAYYPDPATHPGFSRGGIAYHTETDTWTSIDSMQVGASRVTAPSVNWDGQWVIISGEKKAGVRSPDVYAVERVAGSRRLGSWAVLIGAVILVGLGFIFWVVYQKR